MLGEFAEDGFVDWGDFLALAARDARDADWEEGYRRAFRVFDRHGRGYLYIEDMVERLAELEPDMTRDELVEMAHAAKFENADWRRLTYKEFVKMMMKCTDSLKCTHYFL